MLHGTGDPRIAQVAPRLQHWCKRKRINSTPALTDNGPFHPDHTTQRLFSQSGSVRHQQARHVNPRCSGPHRSSQRVPDPLVQLAWCGAEGLQSSKQSDELTANCVMQNAGLAAYQKAMTSGKKRPMGNPVSPYNAVVLDTLNDIIPNGR